MTRDVVIRTDDRPVSWTVDDDLVRVEPVTLEWIKMALRVASTSEDLLIPAYMAAARTHFEEQTGRPTVNQVREYALDAVPYQSVIEIPHPPLVSVSSVKYLDENGDYQTLSADAYRVHPSIINEIVVAEHVDVGVSIGSVPFGVIPVDEEQPVETPAVDPYCPCGRIELVSGAAWPTTSGERCLKIRYVCGYGETSDEIPSMIKATLAMLVAHFHTNRQEVSEWEMYKLPMGAEEMMNAFKYSALVTRPPRAYLSV